MELNASRSADRSLHDLLQLLRCLDCGASEWAVTRQSTSAPVQCRACGARHQYTRGVLRITNAREHHEARQERLAVPATELSPAVGGWDERYLGPVDTDAGLKAAYLSLPYGDGSDRFRTPGYFANVQRFAPEFDFICRMLGDTEGRTLLDLGADGTWSTARLASRGFHCVAVDVTDHLVLSELYQQTCPPYSCVMVDMHAPVFRDESFDVVTAFNALHHSRRLPQLARRIGAMLKTGGLLGFVEPYVQNERQEAEFGRPQSDAGINENVHTVRQWHAAFVNEGLRLVGWSMTDSYNAVYVKQPDRLDPGPEPSPANYDGAALACRPLSAQTTERLFRFEVSVANRGMTAWASRGPTPVRLSYHLYRLDAGSRTLIAFDNARTELPDFISPGETRSFAVPVVFPEAGIYEVEFDLVHETIAWFRDRGGQTAVARCRVS